jgi:tRNA modification GTPase
LIRAAAYIEVHLDFADEDVPDNLPDLVRPALRDVMAEIDAHLNDHRRGEILRDGARVAIVGAPNAGKSSLLNALSQRDVAIVSDVAGTTRDVIDVHLDLSGYPVTLSDTAGLRDRDAAPGGHDRIEAEGIKRALSVAKNADINIVLFDAAQIDTPDTWSVAQIDDRSIVVISKGDVARGPLPAQVCGCDAIVVSVRDNKGIDTLLAEITARLSTLMGGEGATLTRARHRAALIDARGFIDAALGQGDVVLLAEELRAAITALSRITGRVDVEDLLDVIFRDFCIGK